MLSGIPFVLGHRIKMKDPYVYMCHGQNSFLGDYIGATSDPHERLLGFIEGALTIAHGVLGSPKLEMLGCD